MEEYVWISKYTEHILFEKHVFPILRRISSEFKVKISIEGPQDDSSDVYVNAVYEAVKRRVSGMMIVGWGDSQVIPAIKEASKQDIPVLTVERDIPQSKRLAFIGTDWYRLGQAMANSLVNMIQGPGKILIIGCSGLDDFEKGVRGVNFRMQSSPELQVLGPENIALDESGENTERLVTQYLTMYPDLAGIACFNSSSALATARAMESIVNIKTVKVVCVDADISHLNVLRKGIVDVIFAQKRAYATYLAFKLLHSYNHGSEITAYKTGKINIPGNIDTGYSLITKDNIDCFLQSFDGEEVLQRHHLSQKLLFFSRMLDNIREIALIADLKGRIVYATASTFLQLKYEANELLSLNLYDIFDFKESEYRTILNCAENEVCHNLILKAKRKDGIAFPVQLGISPLIAENESRGLLIIALDVGDLVKSEKQAKESEQKFRMLFDNAAFMIIVFYRDGTIVECNRKTAEALGYEPYELAGRNIEAVVCLSHGRQTGCLLEEVFLKGHFSDSNAHAIKKDAGKISARITVSCSSANEDQQEKAICVIESSGIQQ
ncbi:MAG: substrate-binding domain-containing protein [Candidatus Omnitrophica bacterium]|nr:substrate-binding domain-containing protein [Candidatus Omnitrophota bacterium]MBU4479304.1 substrate-binding domain-containing protein [Candidatus Omnitrophota bacterium]MCG2704013.1 substrate-binding domain-containing protein [Candidatus Omnitrophota bacterium]